jgi:hypothetical protein
VKKTHTLSLLRTVALVVLVAGAGVSLGLMLHTGRNNKSVLLLLLFAIWVLSPFIALLAANIVSRRWPVLARVTLYILTTILTLGSLVIYSGVLSPPGTKPAFVFLVVPLVSWIFIAIVIPIAARKLSRRNDGV